MKRKLISAPSDAALEAALKFPLYGEFKPETVEALAAAFRLAVRREPEMIAPEFLERLLRAGAERLLDEALAERAAARRWCPRCETWVQTIDQGETCATCKLVL